MLTRHGHGLAAYALLVLSVCHWLAARQLAGAELGAELVDVDAEPAPPDAED